MTATVGFAIPSIPPRHNLLTRAVASISAQTHPVSQIAIAVDVDADGAGPTRNRALKAMSTDWTCFLDDDDEVYPHHVEALLQFALAHGADVVYPWFDVLGGTDPFPLFEGEPWVPDEPRIFPITVLGRTEVLHEAEFPAIEEHSANWMIGDWPYWKALQDRGAKIMHLSERTWAWHHHGANTSGMPDRW